MLKPIFLGLETTFGSAATLSNTKPGIWGTLSEGALILVLCLHLSVASILTTEALSTSTAISVVELPWTCQTQTRWWIKAKSVTRLTLSKSQPFPKATTKILRLTSNFCSVTIPKITTSTPLVVEARFAQWSQNTACTMTSLRQLPHLYLMTTTSLTSRIRSKKWTTTRKTSVSQSSHRVCCLNSDSRMSSKERFQSHERCPIQQLYPSEAKLCQSKETNCAR